MFYAQLRAGKTSLEKKVRTISARVGVVGIAASTLTPLGGTNPVKLGPLADTGFNSNGRLLPRQVPNVPSANPQTFLTTTGAFPNQLAAIALHPTLGKAYVVSTGASPNGPLRFNSMAQGLGVGVRHVHASRGHVRTERPDGPQAGALNLNQGVNLATMPAPRFFFTNPVAMTWRPNGSDAWVVIQNSDVVVRLTVDGSGIPTINAPRVAGPSSTVRVDLQDVGSGFIAGKAPNGIVINSNGTLAHVSNFISRSVTTIDISNPTAPIIVDTARSSELPAAGTPAATVQLGAELFFTGRGPESRMSFESWGGCIVCHPSGRSDNITWMFETGPRQTINLDGMFAKVGPPSQRALNWSAVRDENHDFELNTRGIFGGQGLIDDDRQFLAIGGADTASPADSVFIEQFQQATGVVSKTNQLFGGAALPDLGPFSARRDFAVATLDDGRVYIIGGRSGAGQGLLIQGQNVILEFNPRTNVLRRRNPSGFIPRHSLGAAAVKTSLGKKIYAIGGYDGTGAGTAPIAQVQEYDPATDTWREVASLPTAVAQFGITVAGRHQYRRAAGTDPRGWGKCRLGNRSGCDGRSSAISGEWVRPGGLDFIQSGFDSPPKPGRGHSAAGRVVAGVRDRRPGCGRLGADHGGRVSGSGSDTGGNASHAAAGGARTVRYWRHDQFEPDLCHGRSRWNRSRSVGDSRVLYGSQRPNAGTGRNAERSMVGTRQPVSRPSGLQVNSPPPVTNFLPVQSSGRDPRQDAIAAWIAAKVFVSPAPVSAMNVASVRGRQLFGQVGLVLPASAVRAATAGPSGRAPRSTTRRRPRPIPDCLPCLETSVLSARSCGKPPHKVRTCSSMWGRLRWVADG